MGLNEHLKKTFKYSENFHFWCEQLFFFLERMRCFRLINSFCLTYFQWKFSYLIVYNESHDLPSSYNYPFTNCTRQCVDEENQEDNENKQNYANDDVLLVIPPDQVIQTLERIYKPREGCVWSAKGEERKRNLLRQIHLFPK